MLTDMSDIEIEISYDITYMWNLKKKYKWAYFKKRNRLTDLENKLMVTRGKGEEQLGSIGLTC